MITTISQALLGIPNVNKYLIQVLFNNVNVNEHAWTFNVPVAFDENQKPVMMFLSTEIDVEAAFQQWLVYNKRGVTFQKSLNGEYLDQEVAMYYSAWSDVMRDNIHVPRITGSLTECLKSWRDGCDFDDLLDLERDGFSLETYNYVNNTIKPYFAAFKAAYMFLGMLSEIGERRRKIVDIKNLPPYGFKVISDAWTTLITNQYMSIN